jgi:glycosyltransferase involved in cell wall biosynthesis
VSGVLVPADVRFPLERANGVQIVKTAAALARRVDVTLLVRHSDPRPTHEILALYGVAPAPGLVVRRLRVGHRRGRLAWPRVAFLGRAGLAALRHLRAGGTVFTRDLQLADALLRLDQGRVVYEAHAVESLMYAERGRLYGGGERPRPGKARRIGGREGRVWRRAAGFVATTAGIRDEFLARHGPRPRVRVVPNGCDVPALPPPPAGGPPRVVYAGQLYPWKGADVLVQAMARVPQARLVILGGLAGEGDHGRVRGLVERLGLAERTEMPGTLAQARVAEELARASVVVAPFLRTAMTERHTSPLKAFEAMAAGRALVASDVPSTREFLRDGETALLVEPGSAAALAQAIERVLDDPGLAGRLGRAAWAEAARYSWDARAAALAGLLAELP